MILSMRQRRRENQRNEKNSVVVANTFDHTQAEDKIISLRFIAMHGVSVIPVKFNFRYLGRIVRKFRLSRETQSDSWQKEREKKGSSSGIRKQQGGAKKQSKSDRLHIPGSEVVQMLLKHRNMENCFEKTQGSCARTDIKFKGLIYKHVKKLPTSQHVGENTNSRRTNRRISVRLCEHEDRGLCLWRSGRISPHDDQE